MQQWTLATPAMLGQFPAAALIYRQGLIAPGAVVADLRLNTDQLLRLEGTPLPQDAAFDELRLNDVPSGEIVKPGQRLDPLLHYVGRSHVQFCDEPSAVTALNLKPFVDHAAQTVVSTTGELKLDYGRGVLTIQSPQSQGASGNLKAAGRLQLPAIELASDLDLAHIVAVALDDQPLATSRRILLQVMTEERTTDFATEAVDATSKRITNIGRDPWQVRRIRGSVAFRRPDAATLRVTALDFNGRMARSVGPAAEIQLQPETLYYLIEPSP
jgi:hypothetical protein